MIQLPLSYIFSLIQQSIVDESLQTLNYFSDLLQLQLMLGGELASLNKSETQKQSIVMSEIGVKKLRQIIQDRQKTIRKLRKKIDKLQNNLKKVQAQKNIKQYPLPGKNQQGNYLEMLKMEMNKSKKLEDIIEDMTSRISFILGDIASDNSFCDKTYEIKMLLQELEFNQKQQSMSLSEDLESELQNSISISQDWSKKIDILQGAIKDFKEKMVGIKHENKLIKLKLSDFEAKYVQIQKEMKNDDIKHLQSELKQERKQREKLKGLLEKTQLEKNQLINKITTIGLKEAEAKMKTREQLLQYSYELNYRVKDLEKQKQDILKLNNKEKESELKKYQNMLKRLKNIRETSKLGKSFA